MTELATRRSRRTLQPADPAMFTAHVEAALAAFAADVSYAVNMARAATVIGRKRAVWQARKELRAAEARAHAECRDTEPFDCHAVAACGTGDCKFAVGEHATLTVAASGGAGVRPQATPDGLHETYSLEEAVNALADSRTA